MFSVGNSHQDTGCQINCHNEIYSDQMFKVIQIRGEPIICCFEKLYLSGEIYSCQDTVSRVTHPLLLNEITSPSTYPCQCQRFIVSDLEIAIASPSIASLIDSDQIDSKGDEYQNITILMSLPLCRVIRFSTNQLLQSPVQRNVKTSHSS